MPNVRSVLQNGMRFTKAWSYPYCSEIRAAVLTGHYPFHTGVGTVITSAANGQLDTAEISIGKLLKNAAAPTKYATANIGKWHLHTQIAANRDFPAALGYDHYSGNFIGDNGDDTRICQLPNPQRAKGTVYENGVHVPMIISGPAVASPGRTSDALVSTTDLFATIVEMAGFSDWKMHTLPTKPVDAVSLVPILKNENTAVHDWVFTEVFDPEHLPDDGKAIRDFDFKLFRFDDGHEEFYKIATDPNENTNLLLQLPLDADAQGHYLFLCNALTGLVGSAACLPSVGVENLGDETKVSVFPNPTTGIFNLRLKINGDISATRVSIVNPSGQECCLVHHFSQNGQFNINLDLTEKPAGVYFIQIQTDSQTQNLRVIKQW